MSVALVPLKHITEYLNSGISRPFYSENKGIPVLRSNNVKNGTVIAEDLKYWYEVDPRGANLDAVRPKPGDILVNFVNGSPKELGKAGVYRGIPANCIVSTNFFIVRLKRGVADIDYLSYFFQSHIYQKWLYTVAGFTGQGSFNKSEFEKLKIPLPAIVEQKAIADLLSTWDEAIEKTERLIQAKERRFRWLLRNFLAATTHLTTSRSWHETVLGRICSITKGTQKNRDSLLPAGEYPVMNGGITPSGYTDEWNTEAHTITISEGGNSCGFVSLMEKRFWCGGHCYALKDLDETIFDHRFLFFYLKSHEPKIMRLRVGSGLPNIQKSDMERFPIKHPSLKEQRKIAELLSLAQQEIDLLKKLSEKYKSQKRGLMQKLLTGQWRVNFDEEVA